MTIVVGGRRRMTEGGKVNLGGVESVGGRGVEGGVELYAPRLVLSQELRENLRRGGD